jgi:hypothetical protein
MSEENERRPIELTTEQFCRKWLPDTATPKAKADFMVDLERVILTRIRRRDQAKSRSASEPGAFSWADHRAVVVKRVYAMALYKSPEGDIVIRQEQPESDDTVVVVPARHAHSVLEAIQRQLRSPA